MFRWTVMPPAPSISATRRAFEPARMAEPHGRTRAPDYTGNTRRRFAWIPARAEFWWPAMKRGSSAARTGANGGAPPEPRGSRCCASSNRRMMPATGWAPRRGAGWSSLPIWIFRSEDGGKRWRPAGAAGFQVLRIEQSPHDACYWMAATQGGGLFVSTDCGVSFESGGNLGAGRNLSDIAFDPDAANRIAVAGWGVGVAVSEDLGKTWQLRNAGLPSNNVWSVAFDPAKPGRVYAGVHEEALYMSQDYGKTWTPDGLEGSRVFRMKFVPERP